MVERRRKKFDEEIEQGMRIHWKDASEYKGKVIQLGPEQSVVRWDNGNERVIVNTWIAPDYD